MGLIAVEAYILLFRITHRRWIATTAAVAVVLNYSIADWERTVLTEAFVAWLVVTLLLLFERLSRRLAAGRVIWFTITGLATVLVRPHSSSSLQLL